MAKIVQITCAKRKKRKRHGKPLRSFNQSGLQIQDLTSGVAKHTGFHKSKYKNVPVGDCIIAATAIQKHARIVSDDPQFDEIKRNKMHMDLAFYR